MCSHIYPSSSSIPPRPKYIMTFPRSTASCCMFIAAITFNVMVTSAYRSSAASAQQVYGDRPYGQGGYEHSYEDRPSHGGYEGHEDEHYYHQEPRYEQHSEGPYDGKHIVPICLQRTSTAILNETTNLIEEKFRCCTPADEPDSCAYNSTDYGYQRARHEHRENDFMGMLGDDHAAVCRYIPTDEVCPPFVGDGACYVYQLNCTLTREATKCGCFAEKGLYFSTTVYARIVESLACLKEDSATTATPFKASVLYAQGAVDAYVTREGYKECQGSVEYVYAAELNSTEAAQKPYPELRWSREYQMIVRLTEHK